MKITDTASAIEYYLNHNAMPINKVEELGSVIEESNYCYPIYCEQSDQVLALTSLAFTTAIVVDIGPVTFSQRFCYEDERDAIIAMMQWHQRGCNPFALPDQWIACRGLSQREVRAGFPEGYADDVLCLAKHLHEQQHNTKLQYFGDIQALQGEIAVKLNCSVQHVRHHAAFLKYSGVIV